MLYLRDNLFYQEGEWRTYCGKNKRSFLRYCNNHFRFMRMIYPPMTVETMKYAKAILPKEGLKWLE